MELSRVQRRKTVELFDAIVRRDLLHHAVAGKQIIRALMEECGIDFLRQTGPEGYVYKTIQGAANEARRRHLLINPNPYARETYSSAVGNAARMKPSVHGWEMTKGILSRHLASARDALRLNTNEVEL